MGRGFETVVGFLVLCVSGVFLFFAYTHSVQDLSSGYTISASFDRIDGICLGADVKIGGVKVGTVKKITLLPESYLASVQMQIASGIKIPKDTTAAIVSEGLIGKKFVSLSPGGEENTLEDGGVLEHTQGAINLETLIGKMMFSSETK
ncbi:MAG: outer membrane lipid asymmetry maintenance protein MlaD [Holosporales bacterium]|jgi:phospholipid/cholesterol/gamma-HCH transport system substrate-binding protein|nr:outer membrane lipid asymmetry maintenance protein MlaD [Holosporales bacterium]